MIAFLPNVVIIDYAENMLERLIIHFSKTIETIERKTSWTFRSDFTYNVLKK